MALRLPSCPDCNEGAPPRLLLWGMGKPFACKGCGRDLVVPKGSGFAIAMGYFVVFWVLKDARGEGWWPFLLGTCLAVIVGGLSWLTMPVRRVD